MRRHIPNMRQGKFAAALLIVLSCVLSSPAQARGKSDDTQTSSILSSEQRTARHFESLRKASDPRKFVSVAQCRQEIAVMKFNSDTCRQYVERSEKAKLQWKLEEQFREFEREW